MPSAKYLLSQSLNDRPGSSLSETSSGGLLRASHEALPEPQGIGQTNSEANKNVSKFQEMPGPALAAEGVAESGPIKNFRAGATV